MNNSLVEDVDSSVEDASIDEQKSDHLETNGPKGPEPTRFGDWERKGRCIDF